jgi:hypothetical protein
MGDINVTNLPPVVIQEIDSIAPVTIAAVQQIDKIAPVAVHIKELNQIGPLQVDSLRIDHVRHIDPLSVERLDVTRLPVVNLSVNQVPSVDVSVRRMPPVSVGIHQEFEMPSNYTARAQLFGFEFLRLQLQGCTRVVPRDCARREQSRAHERSFADVAAVGNPAIPTRMEERSAVAIERSPPSRAMRYAPQPGPLSVGPPRFAYAAQARDAPQPGLSFGRGGG